jgi:hypothetical protein
MYTMMYYKRTKKYSHCQSGPGVMPGEPGFFLIEFIYTFFIVTVFMVIISLFVGLSIQWQQVASNRLLALTLARNQIELLWLAPQRTALHESVMHEGAFTVHVYHEKKQVSGLPEMRHSWVTVGWDDPHGKKHTVRLETFS